jgi:hypothetical protein
MKEQRDFKMGIENNKEFFAELKELAGRIDDGWLPDKPVERLYFDDLPSFLNRVISATPEA